MKGIKVAVEQLQPGIFIQLPLKWFQHPFVLSHFKIKSAEQVKIIKSLGIKYVIAFPAKSDEKPLPTQDISLDQITDDTEVEDLKDELTLLKEQRIEKLKVFRREINRTEKNFQRSMSHVKTIMKDIRSRPVQAIEQAGQLIDEISEQLLSKGDVVLHLMSESKEDEGLYYHSLNVSILAMLLAKKKGLTKASLSTVGMAGLFHDIGKLKVPTQILRKTEPLTAPEENFLKLHPKYSVEILELAESFDEKAKLIIEQHHEFFDGSGHPKGLSKSQLDPLTHILSVVNNYDNLCHPQDIKKAKTPYASLSHLFKKDKHKYEPESLGLLVKLLGIYPPGTVVELDNGQRGLVISVNLNKLLFPNVLLYDPAIPKEQAVIIDLNEIEDIKIIKALNLNQLEPEIYEYLSPRTRVNYYIDHTENK
ncbi:HD-GYP domain-containing protein [Pseudoalteromonas denitrificans]|uniref:HDIG domain-containing protein n=1 Tax=Pseudoalteromonas denitrificans DSM 6059 TaxID=1123010 RepID=A0A1I1PY00_9GAMM|nr:DUF3391 domain-containing protein [Pseudoalteromonas denitrificans]SFD14776.1 HDIG domain-containing protein [Pseudoalteromonas denitrificans DSM 6059]